MLKSFSSCANKSTGSAHPCDQARWLNFLIYSYLNDSKLTTDKLRKWLLDERWPDETASDLICEYEFAKELLKTYEKHQERTKI